MSLMSFSMKMMARMGQKVVKELENMSFNPMEVQKELLFNLLKENADTEYGKAHHFNQITTIEEYQKEVGINNYDNFAPYIERIARGEKNILTSQDVVHMNRTSGTLGIEKMIPLCDRQISIFGKYNAMYINAVLCNSLGYDWLNGKGINLCEGAYDILPSGITYGCASSIQVVRMDKMGPFGNLMQTIYTSPREARVPEKGLLTRYIHARFALAEKSASYIISTFSSNMLELIRYIEENWEMLVNDIETGTISDDANLPDSVKELLLKKIKPNPKRAKALREIFEQGFSTPFVPRIWPKMTYIYCCAGAGFAPYTEKLKTKYLGPDIHVVYLGVSASEGYFSTTIGVDEPQSILVPDCCFMEFLNTNPNRASEGYKTLDQLEVGENYELVITNLCGLYRYQMKDVIKVTGMHNNLPLIEFVQRAGFAVNIFGEKTSELALRHTILETEKALHIDIPEDAVFADVDNTPSRYVFLLEVDKMGTNVTKEQIRAELQKQIQIANPDIAEEFEMHHLDDVKLIVLQKETNLFYRDLMIAKGSSASQLKPVKVIRNEFQRKFFFKLEDQEFE